MVRLRNKLPSLDEHTLEVFTKSFTSLLVRVLGIVAALGVSVSLGRTLGAAGLGIINLATQTTELLLVITILGMDNVLIKRIAIGYERRNLQDVADSVFTSSVINGSIAAVVTVVGIPLAPWLIEHVFHTRALLIPLVISLVVIVPETFSRIFAASLNGYRRVWQSNLVNNTMSIWIVGAGLVVLYVFHIPVTVISVAILYAIGRLVVCCSMGIYWKRIAGYSGPAHFNSRPMLSMALPLLVASGAYIVTANADGVMLGWLRTPQEVGIYGVAARLAIMESFFLMVSNSTIGPKLAALYAQGKIAEMERMVTRVTGGLIFIAIVTLIVFVVYGHWIISLWGKDFTGAYLVLVILAIGQLFNISTGCSGMLLTMCGHEKVVGYLSITFLMLNLILNYFLIRAWGAAGAATATAITVAGENSVKMALAKQKVGILTIPVRYLNWRRKQ